MARDRNLLTGRHPFEEAGQVGLGLKGADRFHD
jgi:hypothetical protein